MTVAAQPFDRAHERAAPRLWPHPMRPARAQFGPLLPSIERRARHADGARGRGGRQTARHRLAPPPEGGPADRGFVIGRLRRDPRRKLAGSDNMIGQAKNLHRGSS